MSARDGSPIIGLRFGKLVVTSRSHSDGNQTHWNCACECGRVSVVRRNALITGNTKSCGCTTTRLHGLSASPEFWVWRGMRSRCTKPTDRMFSYYGGRGITVCERWRNDFVAFIADMGLRPSPSHSIDRIDPNGNYEPGNCRWATPREQGQNKRNNVFLSANGRRLTMSEWSRETGICRTTIRRRLETGMSPEDALSKPTWRQRKNVSAEAMR